MNVMGSMRAFCAWLGGRRTARQADGSKQPARFFIGIGGRPMRLTVSDAASTTGQGGEHAHGTTHSALELRGIARIDGKLVELHDVDRLREPEGRSEGRRPVSS